MSEFSRHLVAPHDQLPLREMLRQPVASLLGVRDEAVTALAAVGIETIFDLGSSRLFAQAAAAIGAADSRLDAVAGDLLLDAHDEIALDRIGELPLGSLRGLSEEQAVALEEALPAGNLRAFALWPQRQLARRMVNVAAGGVDESGFDDTAEELRPRFGEYPTERVYYDALVMLGSAEHTGLTPLDGPLSLGRLADSPIGFGSPAVGALATYSQSWFARGVTLGHMVHSLALAPGEATRIAVVDWARRTRAAVTESIDELERLDNAMDHSRAVSEVQNAVADEMQSGGSMTTGWAKSTSKGKTVAGSLGGGLAGGIGKLTGALGFSLGGSKASQESETESRAQSTSWSVGSRSVLSEMTQRVNDRTEQHATSVRNRRASAVREVSQSEHEEVSTRIVANYNHMHALTVQYYEVVQVYRVATQLHQFERVLFLPFELLDFAGEGGAGLVARFRAQLLRAALTERALELLLDERGRVEIRSGVRVELPIHVGTLVAATSLAGVGGAGLLARRVATSGTSGAGTSTGVTGGTTEPQPEPGVLTAPAVRRFSAVRPGPVAEILPGDARLVSVGFEDVAVERVRIDQPGAPAAEKTFMVPPATDQVDLAEGLPLRSIESILVARAGAEAGGPGPSEGTLILRYESEGRRSIAEVPLALAEGERMQKVAFFSGDAADRRAELLAHLQANRAYYTQAVFGNLDTASLVLLLSGVSWLGEPLVDQVEPRPIAVAGNYLVLRAPAGSDSASGLVDGQTWAELLEDRGVDFGQQNVRQVPIPTGGVFAEAVLGRSNSAEKLDITRFWNWQDSPIPLTPPEIAPVGTGTRATAENLTPGQLSGPVLSLMSPTALPDPAGLSAVLGAIASGSMFRDMSGLAGTQATAQAASSGTLDAATAAGQIASENFKAATAQATEMGKAAADMWKTMKVAGAAGGSGASSGGSAVGSKAGISGEGARINQGRDLDRRGVSANDGSTLAGAGGGASGGSRGSSVTELPPPIFAAAGSAGSAGGGLAAPTVGSRELAYSDEAAAVSPALLGASAAALAAGGPTAFLGPGTGAIGSVLSGFGSLRPTELLLFWMIEGDLKAVGLGLQGARLIPLRHHDNAKEFGGNPAMFAAWTNSAQHIYFNVEWFLDSYTDLVVKQQVHPDDAMASMRAAALLVVHHELEHVRQFKQHQIPHPADFHAMIRFEEEAYGKDVAFLSDAQVRVHMTQDIGIAVADVDAMKTEQANGQNQFKAWITTPPTDPQATLIANKKLPARLGTNKNYGIADLYKTKPPPP